jgi:hypothetical protein
MNFSICIDDYILEISVLSYSKGYPTKTWGKPEDCYPAEDEELEYEIDSAVMEDEHGNIFTCSSHEREFIKNEFDKEIYEALLEEIDKYNEALNEAYEAQREDKWEY